MMSANDDDFTASKVKEEAVQSETNDSNVNVEDDEAGDDNREDSEDSGNEDRPDSSKEGTGKKRKKEMTEEERLEERRAANRRSALESRQRRKNLIDTLQRQVEQLTKETTELRAINDTLRLQLDSSLAENQQFRLIISQQHLGGAGMMQGFGSQMLLGGRGPGLGFGPSGHGGVQPGMLGALGGINPALFGAMGASAGSDFEAQLQLQQRMGLGLPNCEVGNGPSGVISVNSIGKKEQKGSSDTAA